MNKSPDALSAKVRRLVLLLGVPSAGLSLCLTVLSTYLPVLARRFTSSSAVIGLLVGGEGLIAVLVPVWVGGLSDRTSTRLGRRLPFLLATAPLAALALSLVPFAGSLGVMSVEASSSTSRTSVISPPTKRSIPTWSPRRRAAARRAFKGSSTTRGSVARSSAGASSSASGGRSPSARRGRAAASPPRWSSSASAREAHSRSRPKKETTAGPAKALPARSSGSCSAATPGLNFVLGNALLMLALGGLKSFVVLWLTEGLGKSMKFTAAAMTVVALGTVVGALVSGKLADRYGISRVLSIALTVFGVGVALARLSLRPDPGRRVPLHRPRRRRGDRVALCAPHQADAVREPWRGGRPLRPEQRRRDAPRPGNHGDRNPALAAALRLHPRLRGDVAGAQRVGGGERPDPAPGGGADRAFSALHVYAPRPNAALSPGLTAPLPPCPASSSRSRSRRAARGAARTACRRGD